MRAPVKQTRSCWPLVARMALAGLVLVLVMGCASDKEYSQKFASARTDWKGNEVVGVWVSKCRYGGVFKGHNTLLLRPDGTGREVEREAPGNHNEWDVTWHYTGQGKWEAMAHGTKFVSGSYGFTMKYNGSDLLVETDWKMARRMVFVPADNEAAVEEHLKRR